jgi:hypothetical protein
VDTYADAQAVAALCPSDSAFALTVTALRSPEAAA